LILSYAITVHKNQGISLETVVVDAGLYNFAHGQIYVALSRVTTLEGLHLINYDPLSVTADKRAIVQYNDLRERYRPDLLPYALPIHRKRDKNYVEQRWMVLRQILDVQESNDPLDDLANIRGLRTDQFSSFANVTLQLLVLNKTLRGQLRKLSNEHILKVTLDNYIKNTIEDLIEFKLFVGYPNILG